MLAWIHVLQADGPWEGGSTGTVKTPPMRELLHGAQSASTVDPDNTFGVKKKQASKELPAIRAELFSLQERLWAEQKRAVLVVLQGMDTSGRTGRSRT